MSLVDVAILAAGLGASGWCVWHCVRGIRAMRRGRSGSCCPPSAGTTEAQLADLRSELIALQQGRRDESVR